MAVLGDNALGDIGRLALLIIIGIPIEKQESVFERFNKLDTFVPGTGLGLSISRLIAEKMGGSLTIDSTYTTGSRFILILPLKE